jgi:hypothetical protein
MPQNAAKAADIVSRSGVEVLGRKRIRESGYLLVDVSPAFQ